MGLQGQKQLCTHILPFKPLTQRILPHHWSASMVLSSNSSHCYQIQTRNLPTSKYNSHILIFLQVKGQATVNSTERGGKHTPTPALCQENTGLYIFKESKPLGNWQLLSLKSNIRNRFKISLVYFPKANSRPRDKVSDVVRARVN